MADLFSDDIPARANNIGTDIDQIETTLGYIKDVLQQISGGWNNSTLTNFVPGNMGMFKRTQFKYKDADEIYLEPAVYHSAGSTDQMCYWSSQLTFAFGSGGSNASSEDLDAGATEFQYLYLDDSAIVSAGNNVITNSEIINSSTAPAWDAAQWGWYPSSATNNVQATDRCIGAILINASNNVVEFFHDGGNQFMYADQITDRSEAALGTSWTDVTLTLPGFCTKGLVSLYMDRDGIFSFLLWRTNGQTGTVGHRSVAISNSIYEVGINQCDVVTDSSQVIEWLVFPNRNVIMSQAFRCDLCGDCVVSEDLAKAQREVANEPTTVSGTDTNIGIIIKVYKQHVCNACWSNVMNKVKAWADANLGT
jgi:hypothetical protein